MQAYGSFADVIRDYRKSMGWTQTDAAEKWGYSVDTISAWERGKRKPSNQEIPRLARFLKIDGVELAESIKGRELENTNQQSPTHEKTPQLKNALETWGELQHIYRSRAEFNRGFSYSKMLENAHHVLAVGISLKAIARNYDRKSLIDSVVDRECKYQLCFLDPGCQSCISREAEEGYDEGILSDITRINIKHIQNVQRQLVNKNPVYGDYLEIKRYDLPPRFNIHIVDNSLMTVQWYAYGRGEDTPTFVLRRQNDKGLFEFYSEAAHYILEKSTFVAEPTNAQEGDDRETA